MVSTCAHTVNASLLRQALPMMKKFLWNSNLSVAAPTPFKCR